MKGVVLAPAARQLELVRTRQISVTELAEAHIQQIERLNPKLNAFADFDADREQRGLLHGLPVTIKSSIATAGFR
jgi:amidase